MRRLWIPLFWIAFALLATAQTWVLMITHGHSVLRLFLFEAVVWAGWMALTPLVFRLADRLPVDPPRARNILLHLCAAIVLGVVHIVWWMGVTAIIRPFDVRTYNEFTEFGELTLLRLPLEIILYCAVLAAAHANALARRAADLERSLVEARLHALELQIQPHFLFNTLNTVSSLVRTRKNAEAVEMIAGLSELLRYTLDHQGEQRVALEQEADMLQRYLDIQRTRFADRLDVLIDVDANVRRAAVPTLILQPLAENAISHGIARSAVAGRVEFRAFRRDASLRIELFNTGVLRPAERPGLGLRNTAERLRQLYGAEHHFELREANGGVLAEISIPWSEVA